ncbi:YggT family protein [Campylobacter sp. RM12327]|uniref:YggT family protein n=1 Tax=Campylobacter sputorum TaxID=206 RepID=UPI000B76B92F|nr:MULTISPECIES: YggT family protein [Campylobacter]ASM39600.1 putative membrane protein, YGGT family [Campylobacter sputorum]MBE7358781.1 YggT family protein [Campylobacter sp. RM11302]MBF6670051.1 YggT family protein [Campylobacter sp. RM12327]MBF6675178.1 YggT family protein [Campylobacter sp. RM13538]MBF6676776.1 YggT family protein [Campylobacter sp. RM12321]
MIVSNLIFAIASILHFVLVGYMWVIIIAALISWVRLDPYNKLVQTLYRLTEPVYAKIRSIVPTTFGGIDIAPVIVILIIQFLDLFVVRSLFGFAAAM